MGLSFVYPEALWLLALLPVVVAVVLAGRHRLSSGRRRLGLLVRLVVLTSLILGLAGTQIVDHVDDLTTVFLVDASDSIPAGEQARAGQFIRLALQQMSAGDQAAIVVFGGDAVVERLPSAEARLGRIASMVTGTRTNIGAAVQLGLALFPADAAKRLVLLSDGQENSGRALLQAELAAAREIQIDVVPLSPPAGTAEVVFAGLHAPAGVRVGQRFELTALIASTVHTFGRLRIFDDSQLLDEREIQLTPGLNRFAVPLTAEEQGFRRYRAHIDTLEDTRPQNNQAAAFTIIHGPPRILVVARSPDEAAALLVVLEAAGLNPSLIEPASLPSDLAELASYDSIVLVNVPAESLPPDAMEILAAFVRDLGHGLVMVGGETAYGAGGYLRTPVEAALPVDMDVRSRTQEPNVALVMAVDKSGSMGRCHCDDPAGPSVRSEIGIPKVDIAKQAMLEASSVLSRFDYLGVVAFDEKARWALETQPLVSLDALESAIAGIGAEGGTNIMAGLDQAFQSLNGARARIRHVILITDGWTSAGGYDALVQQMHDQGITLSIVAAGRGSAEYLQRLAEEGGGKYYPATTMDQIPRIFLKETIRAVGSYIIEERFQPLPANPTPILTGLSATGLPALRGYNGTTPKGAATVALISPQGDPVLAYWQYGLGRSVAWTSDLTGRWATEWLAWEGFPAFAAQLVGWTLPSPQSTTLASEIRLSDSDAIITVEVIEAPATAGVAVADTPRDFLDTTAQVIGPDLSATEVRLPQVAAGRYEGRLAVSQVGSYLVQIRQSQNGVPVSSQTTGFVVPYSAEYATLSVDSALLSRVAATTGGRVGIEPPDAFAHTLEPVARSRPIWSWLLLLAALLFPLDVANRRVVVTAADLRAVVAWLAGRRPGRRAEAPAEEPLLGGLWQAKRRVTERQRRRPAGDAPSPGPAGDAPSPGPAGDRPASPPQAPAPTAGDDNRDTLSRLRAAKERARHERTSRS